MRGGRNGPAVTLRILVELASGPKTSRHMQEKFGVHQTGVDSALRTLVKMGLVAQPVGHAPRTPTMKGIRPVIFGLGRLLKPEQRNGSFVHRIEDEPEAVV